MAIMNDSGDWFAQNAPQGSVLYPNARGPATASMNPDGSPFTGGITGYGGNPADTSQVPIQAASPAAPGAAAAGMPDTANVDAWLQWQAQQPGADPILQTPEGRAYYASKIAETGGLNPSNSSYWQNKSTLASHGGAVGAGGNTLSGLGGYGGMVNQLPTADEAMNLPGFQFAQQQGRDSIQKSAAGRGTLLTGNTLKALSDYAQGSALNQAYLPLANLKLGYNQANVNNLYNLANLGQNSSTYGAAGRPA